MKYKQANLFYKFLICLILLSLGLMSATITHAEAYKFVTKWGSWGNASGQFVSPMCIAVDSSRNVYVSDIYNYRIEKFDSSGKYITQWGTKGSGNGQFLYTTGIGVDSSDNIYVADFYNNNVQKFDSDGKYITQWGSKGSGNGQFFRPCDVAFDSSGNIYVADFYNNRIQKFDSNGKYLTKWVFNDNPWSVAVSPSGYVYVSKPNSNRTQKFDSNGKLLTQWGSYGIGNGQFYSPRGIAVDSSGNVYVADRANHRIQKFDSNGNFITKWGSFGSGDGQLNYTWDVAVDSSGNVYVADMDNRRIDKFAPTGPVYPVANFKSSVTSGYAPLSVRFIDKSTGSPTSWSWNFGDKSTSTAKNPIHNYTKAGKYNVSLTVKNAADSNTVTKSSYIVVNILKPPVANFSAAPTSGKAPLTVKFTDKSTGSITSRFWNFGDKSTSRAKNPTHKYAIKGKYTVSLTVKNAAGKNTKIMSKYITVK